MLTANLLVVVPGLYEVLIILLIFGAGSFVLVLPMVYAVFAIRDRRRILVAVESLREEIRRARLGPDGPTQAQGPPQDA